GTPHEGRGGVELREQSGQLLEAASGGVFAGPAGPSAGFGDPQLPPASGGDADGPLVFVFGGGVVVHGWLLVVRNAGAAWANGAAWGGHPRANDGPGMPLGPHRSVRAHSGWGVTPTPRRGRRGRQPLRRWPARRRSRGVATRRRGGGSCRSSARGRRQGIPVRRAGA